MGRTIEQINSEIEAIQLERDRLFRSITAIAIQKIRQMTDYHCRLNPFGVEMERIEQLRNDVHRKARPELMIEEDSLDLMALNAMCFPRKHGGRFFSRVICHWRFELATGLKTSQWKETEDETAVKLAVLKVERELLTERQKHDGRTNVEVVRV
jgi:hypothetical protein